jgi:hypothetical protein
MRIHIAGVALAAAFVAGPGALFAHAETPAPTPSVQLEGNSRAASLAEYRQHLVELTAIADACAKARDTRTCDPALVGQDDHLPPGNAPNTELRLVSYGWLRALLTKAQQKDDQPEESQVKTQDKTQSKVQDKTEGTSQHKTQTAPVAGEEHDQAEELTRPPKPTTSQLLVAAVTRLTQDIAQADRTAATPPAAAASHAHERDAMKQVLAGPDFRNLEAPKVSDSFWERVGAWLNRIWASAAKLPIHAAWLVRAIVWGFILAVCVGMAWGLMQMERRWRIRLVPESDAPAPGAASARDWQLWMSDARRSAAIGQWREAVHFVYWAAISRLESKRLWPADRARTPREYLSLVAVEDPRRAAMTALTGSFERTWYGGRAASESDYLRAEELAASLIAGGAVAGSQSTEGGAR